MKLSEYLDTDALNAHVAAGDVKVQTSDYLKIFNYSKTHAYENAWTDVTRKTRGLIWDGKHDRVLAVPFPKFWNKGERPEEEPPETEAPIAVFDKRDGSLGIVWHFNSTWYVATRGSFNSEQARVGSRLLADATRRTNETRQPGEGVLLDLDKERTYLAEIVSPETRIVVDYHGREGLDLLGVIDRQTGQEVPITELSRAEQQFWEAAGRPSYPLSRDVYESPHNARVRGFDAEGYVFLYADGTRLKAKHADYVRLHRVMTGLSSRDVWRHAGVSALRALGGGAHGKASYAFGVPGDQLERYDVERLRSEIPEEMHGWFDQTRAALEGAVIEALRRVYALEDEHGLTRLEGRERAEVLKRVARGDKVLQSLLFASASSRSAIVWRALKPERETFKEDES